MSKNPFLHDQKILSKKLVSISLKRLEKHLKKFIFSFLSIVLKLSGGGNLYSLLHKSNKYQVILMYFMKEITKNYSNSFSPIKLSYLT